MKKGGWLSYRPNFHLIRKLLVTPSGNKGRKSSAAIEDRKIAIEFCQIASASHKNP